MTVPEALTLVFFVTSINVYVTCGLLAVSLRDKNWAVKFFVCWALAVVAFVLAVTK